MNAPPSKTCSRFGDHELAQFSIGCLRTLDQEKVESHLENCPLCLARLTLLSDVDDFVEILQRPDRSNAHETSEFLRHDREPVASALKTSDRYELRESIGSGGMSDVRSAYDRLLDREVAIKVLAEDHHTNPELLRRFERESRVVARLQHPGIPPIYELARLPDGRPFLAMKRVFGKTLRNENLANRHPDDLVDIFQQVCQTVAFAHSKGIVHRDLKPDNIMIGEFGEVQVMDWGIAEDGSVADDRIVHKIVGTPAYMSPEQALGLKCGPRSDVYSLGLLLCDMLTGEAYQTSAQATTIRDTDEERQSLVQRIRLAGIDPRLLRVIEDCVQFEPTARQRDAAELSEQILAYSEARQEDLRRTELEHVKQAAEATQRSHRRRLVASVACLLFAFSAVAGILKWRSETARAKTRVTIRQSIAESNTIRDSVQQSEELGELQLQKALGAAVNAEILAMKSGEPELEYQAKELHNQLESELDDIRQIKTLLSQLDQALRIESEQTLVERFRRVVARRQEAIATGHASAYVFLNLRIYGRSSPFRARPNGQEVLPRKTPDTIMKDFGPLALAYRTIFRYGGLRRTHYESAFAEFGLRTSDGDESFAERVAGLKESVREKIVSGLRLWFLFSAEFQNADAEILARALARIDEQSETQPELLRWRESVREALIERDATAIETLCNEGIPQINDHPEELVWGIGCYESLFFNHLDHRFLRLAQRHFLGSYLLNNELADRYTKAKSPNRALPYLSTAIAAIPSRHLRLALARSILHSKHVDEFYPLRDQCLDLHGDEPTYLLEWADAMAMSKALAPSEVIEMYQRTLDHGFEFPHLSLARIGQVHYEHGDFVSALHYIKMAREVDGLSKEECEELEEAIAQIADELEMLLGPDEEEELAGP